MKSNAAFPARRAPARLHPGDVRIGRAREAAPTNRFTLEEIPMYAKRTLLPALALSTLLVTLPAYGQEEEKEYEGARETAEMDAMMEAWIEAGTPGAEHQWLTQLAGDWNASVKMLNMGPEPVTSEATVHSEIILDGRFLLEEIEGTFMDRPFHANQVTGYNNVTEQYEQGWIDNFSTGVYKYTGTREGNTLTMWGEMKDPATGEMVKSKSEAIVASPDRIEITGYEDRGSGWQKTMEIVYTRQQDVPPRQ